MRIAVTLSLLALGCTDSPSGSGPNVNSFIDTYEIAATHPPELDLLIVLDDTTAMEPYDVSGLTTGAEADLVSDAGTQPDVRIFLTTTSSNGTLRQPAATSDPYLAVSYDGRLRRTTNFTGTFADAFAQLIAVDTTSTAPVRPLEAAKLALDAAAFVRPRAYLGILTIAASDDASTGAVADYVTDLKARKLDPLDVVLAGIYPDPAARLDAFHEVFPNRATTMDIATADFTSAFLLFAQLYKTVLGYPCFVEPADVDPTTPGAQYDCDLNAYYDDGSTERVRQCATDVSGPCFELDVDPAACMTPGTGRIYLRGFPTRYTPRVSGQCVVTE